MFRNTMPRYEVLSEDAMAKLDAGWRRIVTEIGVEFMSERALELFRQAGQKVDENTVFLDPDFVLDQVAKAPREFDVAARNPEHSVHIGGDAMVFGAVYGPPFLREGDVRRDATMNDFRNFAKLSQSSLDLSAGRIRPRHDEDRRAGQIAVADESVPGDRPEQHLRRLLERKDHESRLHGSHLPPQPVAAVRVLVGAHLARLRRRSFDDVVEADPVLERQVVFPAVPIR